MSRTWKITLTVACALYLVVMLAGLLCLAAMGPVFAVVAVVGMVFNGYMVSDWIGMIWNLEGQYDIGDE